MFDLNDAELYENCDSRRVQTKCCILLLVRMFLKLLRRTMDARTHRLHVPSAGLFPVVCVRLYFMKGLRIALLDDVGRDDVPVLYSRLHISHFQ
jgi:hypothetical protein